MALLTEDEGGLGKAVGRQLLRTRRNFTATVFSPDGAPGRGGQPCCGCLGAAVVGGLPARAADAWLLARAVR